MTKNSNISSFLQTYFSFSLLIIVLIVPTSILAGDSLEIRWELVNSFRFITDQNSMDEIRRVYESLEPKHRTAYNLEASLQKLSEKEIEKKRADERIRLNCDSKESDKDKKKCIEQTKIPYEGWFARLAKENYKNTCWDAEKRVYGKAGQCSDYISPNSHRVRVWINNSVLSGEQFLPQWFLNNQLLPKFVECSNNKYRKGTCIEFDLPYDETGSTTNNIEAKFSDGKSFISSLPVTDKLIVGLGDSYAAGEGNPDIPARFTKGKDEFDFFFTKTPKSVPQKDSGGEAVWLDRRCHRSMYSYQFKTALLLALANPRQAITFVSYACSTATTNNIINKPQKPNEGGKEVTPQLDALKKNLANDRGKIREIDYLLLSIGGNDINFGTYVAYIVTSGLVNSLLERFINEKTLAQNTERDFREKLLLGKDSNWGNYPWLHQAMLDGANPIKIKGCKSSGNSRCDRILLTIYPDILKDENGELCSANRQEFDMTFGPDKERAERIKIIKQYVVNSLQNLQRDDKIKCDLGWTVITDHSDKYLNHGFCAKDKDSLSPTGEEFIIPTRKDKIWTPFDPRDYKAYETRKRWVRLPVDSKLTADQVHMFWKFPVDLFVEDDRSNIMHPTAEGLAANADANFMAIKKWEK